MLNDFFQQLAQRLYNENALSDVTWALANSNADFFKEFIELFGFTFEDGPWEIERENSTNGNRPDFTVSCGSKKYIIENKIYDKNYHFKQYSKVFPDEYKCFISNYVLSSDSKKLAESCSFKIASWEQFVLALEDKIESQIFTGNSKLLISGYIKYVREVCGIMEIGSISSLECLPNLHSFNKLIEWVARNYERTGIKSRLYDDKRQVKGSDFTEYCSTRYIEIKKGNRCYYPWIGIYYGEKEENISPFIEIAFGKDWNGSLFNRKDIGVKSSELYEFDDSEKQDDIIRYKLKAPKFQEFNSIDIKCQKQMMLDFLDSVVVDVLL